MTDFVTAVLILSSVYLLRQRVLPRDFRQIIQYTLPNLRGVNCTCENLRVTQARKATFVPQQNLVARFKGVNITDCSDEQKVTRIRDINFQGFATLLTLAGLHDFTNLAVYRIRDVLEVDPDYHYEGFTDVGALFNIGILPAEVNGEGTVQNDMVGGKHWKGRKGFSLGRWNFWKERLNVIAVSEQASECTRLIARKMKANMVAAEEDYST
ncbi:hypothetical protein CPB83DRAFT_900029 [Crepidotus variabilis]|uniref:Uncharacterized protein n=1 Tax=Crepidotus variabilis TaxID=179855 RepID=A0A9P6E3U4_9AGAR|nr:hypothetical protein CPB83DRAFT_900029 [Crepidotus variabilis]